MPGVDMSAFEADADAALEVDAVAEAEEGGGEAEDEEAGAVPPPPEPPPGSVILVEDENAGARERIGWMMSAIVVAMVFFTG